MIDWHTRLLRNKSEHEVIRLYIFMMLNEVDIRPEHVEMQTLHEKGGKIEVAFTGPRRDLSLPKMAEPESRHFVIPTLQWCN
ncbi:hypothetical protein JTE90_023678 [Oedothorax gibbosus]|uniref:Uncharacterized protein n=1 Tax=Oedothorax gibbosus TaxID=931172 RepID=A0AAV6TYC1_9ARAC|nr:hypothetical protein JTE90_023678 [Oedothorax gibbosus]